MNRRLALVAALVLALGALTAGIAIAAGGDEAALSGSTLERAGAAAIAHTRGGDIVEAERGDGGAAYEVEVRLDDGRVVEVSLDDRFAVVGKETDDDGPNDREEPEGQDDD